MKLITAIVMLLCFAHFSNAQPEDFKNLWKDVEKLEADGLPKSALKVVENISELAKTKQNTPQHIKALLHKSKYLLILEEDAQLKIVEDFKAEIANSEAPAKHILENMLASMYWQYFNRHRYQFYNRTHTNTKINDDFRTWDLRTLFEEIQWYFKRSLQNKVLLQQTALSDFDDLLLEQPNSKTFRPSLYDLLSHNALEFYKTSENSISQPAYNFQIDNTKFLSNSKDFSRLNISSKDSTALQLQALKLYQELIQFHTNNKHYEALADVDIERLKFVAQHAIFEDKDAILSHTLQTSSEVWSDRPISGLYDYEIASIWHRQGQQFNPISNKHLQWKFKDAFELCNTVINNFPKSKAAEQCKALKSQILASRLSLTAETFIPTETFSKFLVSYANIDALHFKIYKVDLNQIERFERLYKQDEKLKFFEKKAVYTSWKSSLKTEGDYQNHTTEVIVPKLQNGHYIILSETENESDNTFATQIIQVTDFAIVDRSAGDTISYQVINRINGEPIANATVRLKYQKNYGKAFHTKTLTTNTHGDIRLKKSSYRYTNLSISLTKDNHTGYFDNFYTNRAYTTNDNKTTYKAFVFTDRSIYRPGQTLCFKSIVLERNESASKPIPQHTVTVSLHNVNGEQLSELQLKSNAYGSVAGEFILPNSGLNGQYFIKVDAQNIKLGQRHYFLVEEYKRPKFEAKFEPVTDSFKVNDSVLAKGRAIAYAGSQITDAKVTYRIVRNVQFPRWYYWYRPWIDHTSQEIAHGETTTSDKGEFEIPFKAIPDASINKEDFPVFSYEITADITDINGETRSTSSIIRVGYHALNAQILIPEELDKTKKNHVLGISTSNLNGEFIPAEGTIKIYKLLAPNRVLRNRPWNAPDYQTISKSEFINKFPHEAYANEENSLFWEKGKLVFESTFNTATSKEIALKRISNWESGKYIILLESKDMHGHKISSEARTTIYSKKDKSLADQNVFHITTNKNQYMAGELVTLSLASAATDVTVTINVEKHRRIINTYIVRLNNNKKTFKILVNEDDIGGFTIHYSYAFQNSYVSNSLQINVPYPDSDLQIETQTFRDKLIPGTDETWRFKIKGPKGEKVTAEVLASMYDMSLDQFQPHSWYFNPIQKPTYYSRYSGNARQSFAVHQFMMHNQRNQFFSYSIQNYDQLNWFGLSFGNNFNYYRGNVYEADAIRHTDEFEELEINDIARPNASFTQTLSGQVPGLKLKSETGEARDRNQIVIKGATSGDINSNALFIVDGKTVSESAFKLLSPEDILSIDIIKANEAIAIYGNKAKYGAVVITTRSGQSEIAQVKVRKNLQETAFFFPQLQTDEEGYVNFSFTTPEALTKWKLQLLAHNKTMESAISKLESVTQKELMVIPNSPRFFRQGDRIQLRTKIANLSSKLLEGTVRLELTDALNGTDLSTVMLGEIGKNYTLSSLLTDQIFEVEAEGNTNISWTLKIPDAVQAIQYRIIATARNNEDETVFSDGEQNVLPVLTNRMLVTETLPMWIKSNTTKSFTLEKLRTSTSETLKHHKLTLEITSNPIWYAVQALPYLMEYPYDCNEQTFSRYYANALASHIANNNPKIQAVFEHWITADVLISNLEKNQDLKSIIIQETPWLRDAQNETEQKKRIALLFDFNKMKHELDGAIRKLKTNQLPNGAWPWFNGGQDNRLITQHIVTGFARLKRLNVEANPVTTEMIDKAIIYLDAAFIKEYKDLKKYNANVNLSEDHLSNSQLHHLYLRSLYPDEKPSEEMAAIMTYYYKQIQSHWRNKSLYSKGLMALIMNRQNDHTMSAKILKSLEETSITSDELGMYWKENTSSWNWYQASIETQALMIEVFSEIQPDDQDTIDNLKIWLLKNKQTNQWKTTKATTEAIYALLLQGSDWLSVSEMVDVTIGGKDINPSTLKDVAIEAGSGYYKTSWSTNDINPSMASVELHKTGEGIAWGSLYWQYFEDLDRITTAETPLQLKKKLFKRSNTDTGEELDEITTATQLNVGDLVRVRIELRSDRPMEFVHMKDMRASGLEPVNVLSQYKWQDGLGYYESTKDASTNFFFDYLPQGVYVFEYDLRVTNAGQMSNGITTIQSMYAPEFSSHSEGSSISVN